MPSTALPMSSRPPVSLTSLVGRDRELDVLAPLVAAQRLVTLTGVGGGGKTRLAAELGLRIDWQRAESVAWVSLGTCSDPVTVAHETAVALSLRPMRKEEMLDALVDALRDRDVLLVLDNCEHLIEACAGLARTLLLRCPNLHILATSREPLGVAGEHVFPVPPIATGDAVQLFAERAAAVAPAFALTDENRGAVAEVCGRLDGIPLAIELAAARIRVLTAQQIAAKLEDRFAILTGGARTTVARHRTLRAAIDWSFALLSDEEQALLARLSVFAGGFSLETAEQVCGADLDLLTSLVDKSLVLEKSRAAVVRYQLLETIRQYAAERLGAEADEVRRAHAVAFLAMAREATVDPMADVLARLEQLDTEHDNMRAALAWSLEHEPDAIALPLGAAFRWYWYYRILWSEGLRWLQRVVERSSPSACADRARALSGAGTFAAYAGDPATARPWLDEAVAMGRGLGASHERELALTLSSLAQLLANTGELDAAAACAEESVALARKSGTPYDIAYCLTNATAFTAQRRGDCESADRALEEAEAIWSPTRHPLGLPFVLSARALLALRRGDAAAAERFARAALVESRPRCDRWFAARSLRVLASTCTNELPRAARLIGAADAMLRAIGARILAHEKGEHEQLIATLRAAMPEEELAAALTEGSRMSFEDACTFALASSVASETASLEIDDLGSLQLTLGGKPLAADGRASNRSRELLVFLASHPQGRTKDEVGVAFWPEGTAEQVKNAFHVTLHRLRKVLGNASAIVADGARYCIAIPHVVQSRRFESELANALRRNDVAQLERALALYAGDFLQGEDAGEWCLPIRAQLRQLYQRGLLALAQAHESRGRYTDAAETYTRVLARDPFHEAAARQLMICNARLGARSESLLVYRQLEQRLRDDLQAAPEPETRALYQRLRQNEVV